MSNFTDRDLAVVMYLEDPNTSANRVRTLVQTAVTPGSSYTSSRQSSDCLMGFLAILRPYDSDFAGWTGYLNVTIRAYRNEVELSSKSKRVACSCLVGFSATELLRMLRLFKDSVNSATIAIENRTNKVLSISYAYWCPLELFRPGGRLVSLDHGERMGNDQYYPDFGLCNAYGSFRIRDDERKLAIIVDSPSTYGFPEALARYEMRVEVFLADTMVTVMEVDSSYYSDSGRDVEFRLKSPFIRLSEFQSYGNLVIRRETKTLSRYAYDFLMFSKNTLGLPLGTFDFSSMSSSSYIFRGVSIELGVLQGPVDVSTFIDYACQASASSMVLNPTLSTNMKYRPYTVSWFPNVYQSVNIQSSREMPAIGPSDLMDAPMFDVVRKNFVDKVTYTPYDVSVEEQSGTVDTKFRVTDYRAFSSHSDDKSAYLSEWLSRSSLSSVPSDDVAYGTRFPRPKDLTYDSASGKYGLPLGKMSNRQMRALTRAFLWRFPFVTDHSDANSLSGFKQSWSAKLSDTYADATFRALSTDTNGSVFHTGGADLSGTSRNFAYPALDYDTSQLPYRKTGVTYVNAKVSGVVERTCYNLPIFQSFGQYVDFYANVSDGRFLAGDYPMSIDLYASYWYSPVHAGEAAIQYLEGEPDYASSMRCVSGNMYDNLKSWSESKASKMSEYICLEYTSEQAYCVETVDSYEKTVSMMVWSPSTRYVDDINPNALHANRPATDYDGNGRVGTEFAFDGDYYLESASGGVTDYADHECYGVSRDDDDGMAAMWPRTSYVYGWHHTGDDDDAHGGYVLIGTQSSVSSSSVVYDPMGGMPCVKVSVPSDSSAKSRITSGSDNFIGQTADGSSDHPGRWRAADANPFCCFWNSAYAFSLLGNGRNGVYNFDESSKPFVTWYAGRPSYGYVLKDLKAVVTARYYKVEALTDVVVQFNRGNRYNYGMATNPLMSQYTLNGGEKVTDWIISSVASAFANGRRTMSLKTRAVYGSISSGVYLRVPRLGDLTPADGVKVIRDGEPANVVPSVSRWFLRGFELVYENGELYYNLELMEAWGV